MMEFDHDDDEAMSVVPTTPVVLAQCLRDLGFNLEMEVGFHGRR